MIPKVIHYCWFGRNQKSELVLKCIDSWKKFAPDFKIIEWNESNFDISEYDYANEAYQKEKWSFVSDVARFYVLKENGGIYLDTDVELLKPIDEFIDNQMFMAYDQKCKINPGLIMGAVAEHYLLDLILEYYRNKHFLLKNGMPDTTTVVSIVSQILEDNGFVLSGKNLSAHRLTLYNATYFDPYNFETKQLDIQENTISIHHYTATWKTNTDMFVYKVGLGIKKIVGEKLYSKIAKFKHKIVG